jgi:hypothetical protein
VNEPDVGRFVLFYRGPGNPDETDISRIVAVRGVQLIDRELPRLLLVEGPEEQLRTLISQLGNWKMLRERTISL